MGINPKIFKAYDIRGIYPDEINEKAAYNIGRAIAVFLKAKKIAAGRDIRKSSPILYKNLSEGIIDQGTDFYNLGLISTPMAYFASGKLDVDGAISLTASHNPPEYNGIKICSRNAFPIGEYSGIYDIRDLARSGNFSPPAKKGQFINKEEIKEEYYDYIASFAQLNSKKFKVIADVANAMGILELEIFKRLAPNIEITALYDNFDSTFPNHEANPIKKETLDALQKKVIDLKADLGIAYDGDADRIVFIDEKGEIAETDLIIAVLAKAILEKHPGGKILYDLRASRAVKETVEENGGKAVECPVGHAKIKKIMRDQGAVFAGELSGHYFFTENFLAEAPTLAAIMILNLMAKTGNTLSQQISGVKKYYHSGEINFKIKDAGKMFDEFKSRYSDGVLNEMDGIKIDYSDWWFNLRPSNTEPIVRLTLEANTKELLEQKKKELVGLIGN